MGILQKLRELSQAAHERSHERRKTERSSQEKDAALRKLRRKMRIFPGPKPAAAPSEVSQGQPAGIGNEAAAEDVRRLEADPRTSIISVRGKDVKELPKKVPENKERKSA